MKVLISGIAIALVLTVGTAVAESRPGVPQRDFHGRTFYIESPRHYSPVWYAGNGIIATRKLPGVPLWPQGQFDKYY